MIVSLKYNIDKYHVNPTYLEKQVLLITHGKYSQGRITVRNTFIGKKVLVVLMTQSQLLAPKGMMRVNTEYEPFYDALVTEVKSYSNSKTSTSGAIFVPAIFGGNKVRVYVLEENSGHSSA